MIPTRQDIQKFHAAVPLASRWIDDLLAKHAHSAMVVSQLPFGRISECYPKDFLDTAKIVVVDKTPRMPLEDFGLPGLAKAMPDGDGITFKDTYFVVKKLRDREGLHFHELVHVAQWRQLGVQNFLMAYGIGLVTSGYRNSPLEDMAYGLQAEFEHNKVWPNLLASIGQQTDEVWRRALKVMPA